MKKNKVLSDLRSLTDDIDRGYAEIRKYEYSFEDYEYDYGEVSDDIEIITLHVKRLTWPEDR